jgi:hypothetical protein
MPAWAAPAKPPGPAAAKVPERRIRMLRARPFYPEIPECLITVFDLRDLEAVEELHRLRAVWQEDSDLEALGPDHMVVFLFPGVAAGRLAA